MNTCLCCGKAFSEKASDQELKDHWHKSCIRKFFGVDTLPELDQTEDGLLHIATESANHGFTVPGVQKKMSIHLSNNDGKPSLTLVDYPSGFILKPQTETFESLPESEFLVMQMAEKSGIAVVPYALIHMSKSSETAYITKRVDRIISAKRGSKVKMLAMEDFCQLESHSSAGKYLGSYERCAKLISRYSIRPGIDLSELFMRVVFSFVTGNSDMHLKNLSMIETHPESEQYVLSPAYDMLPVNLLFPDDKDQMALAINGKKRNIHQKDFIDFAEASGITKGAAIKMIKWIVNLKPIYLEMCNESLLPASTKEAFSALIEERNAMLQS